MPYPYPKDDDERKISKFDSRLAQNMRLDALWQECNLLSRNGDLSGWNWTLDALWRELSGDSLLAEFTEMKRLNTAIANSKKDKAELYKALNEKEIFLRRLQNKQGKGTAYRDKEEDMM